MKFITFTFAIFVLLFCSRAQGAAPRPNVVLIIVDDLGWRDLSCYGSTFYQTVNIDRLAREGARFTDAYAAQSRCSGARPGIMTGKSPVRQLKPDQTNVSIGQAFRDAGYVTFYCGKWFISKECDIDQRGFTKVACSGNGMSPASYFAPYNKRRGASSVQRLPIRGVDAAPVGEYLSDRLTDETISFIRANKDRPFFVVLSHYAVCSPLEAKANYVARYRQKLREKPPASGPDWEVEGKGQNKLKQDNPEYAAMIHSVDEGVGRILDLLNEFKVADRTLVVLCSDNGGVSCKDSKGEAFTSNRPLRGGRGSAYEGGIRVPLIVKWPGVVKGAATVKTPVMTTDLYPTFLEIAGLAAKPEQHVDGRSFASLLKGLPASKAADSGRCLFWHNATADASYSAIRCGQFKFIDFFVTKRSELYDLNSDVEERHNLIQKLGPKGEELKTMLDRWRTEVDVPMLTPGDRAKARKAKKNK